MNLATPSQTQAVLARLKSEQLIAVIRGQTAEDALWGSRLLIESGLLAIEITYTTPDAPRVIEALCEEYPHALIGAGTVIEARTAMSALGAGAQFLASPVLEPMMVQFGAENDVLVLPGVMTPTEMYQAIKQGATALKLFPAEPIGGAAFVRSILAPLPDYPLMPTGGIHLDNFTDYLQAGAVAVGLGNHLLPTAWMAARNEEAARERIQAYFSKREAWRKETAHASE